MFGFGFVRCVLSGSGGGKGVGVGVRVGVGVERPMARFDAVVTASYRIGVYV